MENTVDGTRDHPAAHLKVRVDQELADALRAYATARQLSVSDAVRVLLRQALEPAPLPEDLQVLPPVAFANLIATEHVLRLLLNHFPKRDSDAKLQDEATEAARDLLLDVQQAMEEHPRRSRPWPERRPTGLARFLIRPR